MIQQVLSYRAIISFVMVFCFFIEPSFARDKKSKEPGTNQLLHSYLNLLSFRHKILSQNVSNVNTPGYKAEEVNIPENIADLDNAKLQHRKLRLKNTSPKHMKGNKGGDGHFNVAKLKDPFEVKPNGNNVSLNQQITKISQNQTSYDTAVKTYAVTNSLVSTVLGK